MNNDVTIENAEAFAKYAPKEPYACSGAGECVMDGTSWGYRGLYGESI